MPIYDFICNNCETKFEELSSDSTTLLCPNCASEDVSKVMSCPSPLKTGAAPFKVGPVHAAVTNRLKNGVPHSCGQACGSNCGTAE